MAYAEVINANDIFIGVNALDYSGYPDCRPEFIMSFEKMANLATASGVSGNSVIIHAPLIHLTKAQIISKGIELNVDYGNTTSCYDPSPEGYACGQCDACLLRLKGFSEVGIKDPKKYRIHQKKWKCKGARCQSHKFQLKLFLWVQLHLDNGEPIAIAD